MEGRFISFKVLPKFLRIYTSKRKLGANINPLHFIDFQINILKQFQDDIIKAAYLSDVYILIKFTHSSRNPKKNIVGIVLTRLFTASFPHVYIYQ